MTYEIRQYNNGYKVVVRQGNKDLRSSPLFNTMIDAIRVGQVWIANGAK